LEAALHKKNGNYKLAGKSMSLISVLIILVIAGFFLWVVNAFFPMPGKIKKILNVAVVVIVALWLIIAFGLLGRLSNRHMDSIHMGSMHRPW